MVEWMLRLMTRRAIQLSDPTSCWKCMTTWIASKATLRMWCHTWVDKADTHITMPSPNSHTDNTHIKPNMCLVTISGPQAEPSAAGMNLVSHFLPTRWHQRALQMSWNKSKQLQYMALLTSVHAAYLKSGMISFRLATAANKISHGNENTL